MQECWANIVHRSTGYLIECYKILSGLTILRQNCAKIALYIPNRYGHEDINVGENSLGNYTFSQCPAQPT